MSACKGVSPLHDKLHGETAIVYANLRNAERTCQDAGDAAVEAMGVMGRAEIAVENAIRDIDAEAARLDRVQPGLNAQYTLFPGGFGVLIDPEGKSQLDTLPALHVQLLPFKAHGAMADRIAALEEAEAAFKAAIAASEAADVEVDKRFTAEREARRAVREQLASSHGRLRDFYKSRTALAERFFLKERKRSAKPVKLPPPAPPLDNGAVPEPA
jgi:hypothetical protein